MEEVRTEEEILAGKHSVLEALRAGRTLNKIWVAETAQKHLTAPIIAEARKAGIVIQHVDKRKLDQLDGMQRAGGNVPYSDFDEDERYDSDDMDYGDDGTDDSDDDMNNDAEDYDASDQDGFDEYGTEDSNDFSDDYGDDNGGVF